MFAKTAANPGKPTAFADWKFLAMPGSRPGFLLMLGIYVILSLVFYPRMVASVDEATNVTMAAVLRKGTIYPADLGYELPMSPSGPYGLIYRFPIGYPVVLALLSYAGTGFLFLLNPLLHLLATVCFSRLLKSQSIPRNYALLYLFYPSFILYNRTLFSDPFAASLTTIALYALTLGRRGALLGGVLMGVAFSARSMSLAVTVILGAGLLWREVMGQECEASFRRSKAFLYILGTLPFLLLTLVYNRYTTGSYFRSTYDLSMLNGQNFLRHAPDYALSLLVIFPGMLLAPFAYRGRLHGETRWASACGFLLAAAYFETTYGENALQSLVTCPRQMLPVLPFFLLAYCGVLTSVRRLAIPQWLRPPLWRQAVGFGLMLMAAAIATYHNAHLNRLASVQAEMRTAIPAGSIAYGNKDTVKLYQPTEDTFRMRELPYIPEEQIRSDLARGEVHIVLFLRHRGIPQEENLQNAIFDEMERRFVVERETPPGNRLLQCYRLRALREAIP